MAMDGPPAPAAVSSELEAMGPLRWVDTQRICVGMDGELPLRDYIGLRVLLVAGPVGEHSPDSAREC